jgi:DNA-binding NarL/FixJ family response regulator
MVAESFRRVLGETHGIEIVGVATNAAEAVALAMDHRPDVLLMDYELPDADGAAAARAILARLPETKILMLSGSKHHRVLIAAVGAGCVGYVAKGDELATLVAAIRAAAAGQVVLSPVELRLIAIDKTTRDATSGRLTPREVEILDLVGEGLVNQVIAERLTLSLNTVRTHVQTVLTKLGAHSKLEAVAVARKRGLLTRP